MPTRSPLQRAPPACSDGASYALSLGLGNPQLFTHLVAFSPGFMRPPPAAAAWLDAAVAAAAAVAGTAATASAVGNSTTARLALPTPEAGGSTPGATDAAQAAAKAQAQAQERVMAETATLTTAKPLGVSAVAPAKAAAALETVARQAVHLQGGGRLPRVFVAHGRGGRDPAGALLAPHRVAAAGCGLGRGVQGVSVLCTRCGAVLRPCRRHASALLSTAPRPPMHAARACQPGT